MLTKESLVCLLVLFRQPSPWAFMLGNTYGWIFYSILVQDLFVFFGNAPGFLMAFWLNLQAAKMQYETFRSIETRKSIIRELEHASRGMELKVAPAAGAAAGAAADTKPLVGGSPTNDTSNTAAIDDPEEQQAQERQSDTARIVCGVVSQKLAAPAPHEHLAMANVFVWLAITALISFASAFSDRTKELIVGISVNLNLVVFYGAPLSTILTVLTTKSSSSIHVRTMLTNTFNGLFWAAYGIAITDLFIAVPNSLGAGLGVIQIMLCLFFPRKKDAALAVDENTSSTVDH